MIKTQQLYNAAGPNPDDEPAYYAVAYLGTDGEYRVMARTHDRFEDAERTAYEMNHLHPDCGAHVIVTETGTAVTHKVLRRAWVGSTRPDISIYYFTSREAAENMAANQPGYVETFISGLGG